MPSSWIWGVLLAVGVGAPLAGAAIDAPLLHLGLTALVCLGFVLFALLEHRRLAAAGAGEARLASATATAMGLVWAWAALSLLLTYLLFHTWGEWWQYVVGEGAIAALCLLFAAMLSRDADAGREDRSMLNLARYLAIGQLAGMIVAMIGLVLDGKMPRDPQKPDWAASAVFFFGAAALAAISANGLRAALLKRA